MRKVKLGDKIEMKISSAFCNKGDIGFITNGSCFHNNKTDVEDQDGMFWADFNQVKNSKPFYPDKVCIGLRENFILKTNKGKENGRKNSLE